MIKTTGSGTVVVVNNVTLTNDLIFGWCVLSDRGWMPLNTWDVDELSMIRKQTLGYPLCPTDFSDAVSEMIETTPKGKKKAKTRGEVFEELLVTWNKTMVAEKLVKQINLTQEGYIKEELITHLLTLTNLLETAESEGVLLSQESKKKIVDMLGLIQRVIPAMEGLEQASTSFFKEALDSLLETKGSLKFQVRPK